MKLDKMGYTVGIDDELVKVENKYEIDMNQSYLSNVINMTKNKKLEKMNQMKNNNIEVLFDDMDQLTINAYYSQNNNSINLLLGYIYAISNYLEINDLENDYYKILGSIGAVIGHELTHSLDTSGSKYDENGNYINWWTEEDKFNFNNLINKVIKYYENYEQLGDTTIGENIADLGGVALVLQIAENKNATIEDYKTIFENYAKIWASQKTPIIEEYYLKEDNHSPDKNRVNAVLSTFDKFYEIYNIKESDKMYVTEENRVKVW